MSPFRVVAICFLIALTVIVQVLYAARISSFVNDLAPSGKPRELLRAHAQLDLGLRLAEASATSGEYAHRFQYPRGTRGWREPLVQGNENAQIREQTRAVAQGFALNEFVYLTLNTLPGQSNFRSKLNPALLLPRPLRQAHEEFVLSLKSSALEFDGTYFGPPLEHQPLQRHQRRIQRDRQMAGTQPPAYVRKQQLADAWAVQKLKLITVNTVPSRLQSKHARSVDEPPPGLAEHYFAFRFGLEKAINAKHLEVRKFVEGINESEIVFAPQFLKDGVVSKGAAQVAMLEQDAAAQEFVILRNRSPLFARTHGDGGTRPSPVLLAEFSRLRCQLITAFAKTDLEIEQHLQENPNAAAANAMAIRTGRNPLFDKKLRLMTMQAWAEVDESFLDVLNPNYRNVNLLSFDLINQTDAGIPPHPMLLAHAKMEIANTKAAVAQSSAIRSIQLGPTPFGIEAADQRQIERQSGKRGGTYMNEMIDRQTKGAMQWFDFLEKMKQTGPLAANENLLSRELGVVDFHATTKSTLPAHD